MKISGSCHCGNIRYQLTTRVSEDELAGRQCPCSYCSRLGAIYTSDPGGTLSIEVRDPSRLSTYQFASKLVDFKFCAICGIMPLAKCRIDGRQYGVVNLRTANIDLDTINITELKIAAESTEESIARRRQKWTPIV